MTSNEEWFQGFADDTFAETVLLATSPDDMRLERIQAMNELQTQVTLSCAMKLIDHLGVLLAMETSRRTRRPWQKERSELLYSLRAAMDGETGSNDTE